MFKKYNDTPAAIAIGLVTVFFIIQVILMAFTGETWLEDAGIDPTALPFVYWLCFIFATFAIGLIPTFVKGPDGQRIFFNVLLIGQIGGVIGNLIEIATDATTADPLTKVRIKPIANVAKIKHSQYTKGKAVGSMPASSSHVSPVKAIRIT
jgi:hypothetical protein